MTAPAVNCLETDPASKIVPGVLRMSCSRSAIPYARDTIVAPSRVAPTAQPGDCAELHRAKTLSTRASCAADCALAAVGTTHSTKSIVRSFMATGPGPKVCFGRDG